MAEEYFIVSLDFDGVLAQGYKAKIRYTKEWFGIDLPLTHTKEEGFDAFVQKLGKDLSYRSLMDPLNEKHIMEFEMPENCAKVISRLYGEGCRFVVITSRNDHDYPYAVQFINEKLGGLIKYVHNTRKEPKAMFVSRLHPRIHVDDDIPKLLPLQEHPVELVYFRQPENDGKDMRTEHRQRMWEARSFDDLQVIINRIKLTHSAICWKEGIANNWTNVGRIYAAMHSLSSSQIKKLLADYQRRQSA